MKDLQRYFFNFFLSKRSFTVYHLSCQINEELISKIISQNLFYSFEKINKLFFLGSIYYRPFSSKEKPKRIFIDQIVHKNDYLRVYSDTSRYNVENIQWKERILYNSEDFLVIDKPNFFDFLNFLFNLSQSCLISFYS